MSYDGEAVMQNFNAWVQNRYPGSQEVQVNKPDPKITVEQASHMIANFESFRDKAYKPIPTDPWTIGFGSTFHPDGTPVKPTDKIDRPIATQYLVKHTEDLVHHITGAVKVPLKQNQLTALTSFVYNIGTTNFDNSTMLKLLNAGKLSDAANQFGRWVKGNGGKVVPGLVARRKKEKDLFTM